jgi:hypothetical protein
MPPALPKHDEVTIRAEWSEFLAGLSGKPRIGAPPRTWTKEEDAFLTKARELGASWRDICKHIGCCEDTARHRLRELQDV